MTRIRYRRPRKGDAAPAKAVGLLRVPTMMVGDKRGDEANRLTVDRTLDHIRALASRNLPYTEYLYQQDDGELIVLYALNYHEDVRPTALEILKDKGLRADPKTKAAAYKAVIGAMLCAV